MKVEFIWFHACPSHGPARALLADVLADLAPGTPVDEIEASDPALAERLRFPGSPTIRIDGRDIQPGFIDPGDYAPRCRVFPTHAGLRGVPPREWIEDSVRTSLRRG